LEKDDFYNLVLKTKLSENEIIEKFKKYDENINLKKLFEEDDNSFYELNISKDSLLRKELLENVSS
jgi:arsenate reductase-like glutaredoxin family protein